jgi:hypothetical protein
MFVSTFGQWYLSPPVNKLQLLYLIGFIIFSSSVFFLTSYYPSHRLVEGLRRQPTFQLLSNSYTWMFRGGGKNTMQRFIEMKCFQEYLQYLQQKKEYDVDKTNATKSLKMKKTNYLLQKLQKFDQHIKINEKRSKWGWSPLYHLLKRYPLDSSPQRPWEHTKIKLQNIINKMEKESQQLTLDTKCPHIVRTFKLFYKSTFGRLNPIVHANKGLILHNILHYYPEQGCS